MNCVSILTNLYIFGSIDLLQISFIYSLETRKKSPGKVANIMYFLLATFVPNCLSASLPTYIIILFSL